MTPRPIYRRKSFWLGLFAACFLAWAWWDSMCFISSIGWRRIHAGNGGGGFFLEDLTPSSGTVGPVADFRRSRLPMHVLCPPGVEVPAFSRPLLLRGGGNENVTFERGYPAPASYIETMRFLMNLAPSEDWQLILPHWLVLLAFLVPWSAFLVWRVRRAKLVACESG